MNINEYIEKYSTVDVDKKAGVITVVMELPLRREITYKHQECLESQKCEENEILGFRNMSNTSVNNVDEETKLLQYIYCLNSKIISYIDNESNYKKIPYEVNCIDKCQGKYMEWFETFTSIEKRKAFIEEGITYGKLFYQYYKQMK